MSDITPFFLFMTFYSILFTFNEQRRFVLDKEHETLFSQRPSYIFLKYRFSHGKIQGSSEKEKDDLECPFRISKKQFFKYYMSNYI